MTDIKPFATGKLATLSWYKRIAWRRVLPIAQLALAAALFASVYEHDRLLDAEFETWTASHPTPAEGEAVTFDLRTSYGYIDPRAAVLVAIDLPASVIVLPAVPVVLLLEHFGYGSHKLGSFAFLASVAILWYCIGRAIDRRLGSIPTPPKHREPGQVMIFIIRSTFGLLLVMALVGFVGCILSYHHGPWNCLILGSLGVWSTIFAHVLRRRLMGSSRK